MVLITFLWSCMELLYCVIVFIRVCMYVCMHMFMCACMRACVHVCTHACMCDVILMLKINVKKSSRVRVR